MGPVSRLGIWDMSSSLASTTYLWDLGHVISPHGGPVLPYIHDGTVEDSFRTIDTCELQYKDVSLAPAT